MLSTGREYDRFVIALVIITLLALAFYVVQCNQNQSKMIQKKESELTQRLNYLSGQVQETGKTVKDLINAPVLPPEGETEVKVEQKDPAPVSSSFLG